MKKFLKNLSIIIRKAKSSSSLYIFAALTIFLGGCRLFEKDEKQAVDAEKVAEVHGSILYKSDLKHLFTSYISEKDSIRIVNEFIDQWIRHQLLYQKALSNLTKEEKNKENELEEYYQSLIIYEYEKKIARQQLDTVISEEEKNDFYENNRSQFVLRKCILRSVFLKVINNAPDLNKVRKLIASNNDKDIDLLHQYCVGNAEVFNIDDTKWFYLDEVSNIIPLNADDCSSIAAGQTREINDSLYTYFIKVYEIKAKGAFAPFTFAQEQIESAIIYQRKIELLKKIREKVYEEGIRKKYFKVYEK